LQAKSIDLERKFYSCITKLVELPPQNTELIFTNWRHMVNDNKGGKLQSWIFIACKRAIQNSAVKFWS